MLHHDQEMLEQTFSKRQLRHLLSDDIVQTFPMDIFSEMYADIETFLKGKYRRAKQERLAHLSDIDAAVDAIILSIASDERPQLIQKVATKIGHLLNYPDPDAARTGAELLAVTQGHIHEIAKGDDGSYYIIGKLSISKKLKKKIALLQYLPPAVIQPKEWDYNVGGGYYTEQHSILLGRNTHHWEPQAYDVLNKLQSIAWELDLDTVDTERNTNMIQMTVGKKQFRRTVKSYRSKPFWFIHKYDKRGRIYSAGYDLNIQGSEYHKACLNFFDKKIVNVDGMKGLKIAIAGHAGHDKITWQERLDWFDTIHPQLTDEMVEKWDEPILGRKALRAYNSALRGEPIGYPMALDATSSGIQMLAVLSGCAKSAKACNLINTGQREDIYLMVADKMNLNLDEENSVTRKDVKKPIMTAAYNSRRVPREAFNDAQLSQFYRANKGVTPGVIQAMNLINMCWQDSEEEHRWTLPDGHVAVCPVEKMVDTNMNLKELPFKFTYRYAKRTPNINAIRSLAPNITHSVDAYVCREMIRRCPFQLASIHDCFLFHPNHWKEVCQIYREVLADLAQMDLLQSILREITGEQITIEKSDPQLSAKILKSEYALS